METQESAPISEPQAPAIQDAPEIVESTSPEEVQVDSTVEEEVKPKQSEEDAAKFAALARRERALKRMQKEAREQIEKERSELSKLKSEIEGTKVDPEQLRQEVLEQLKQEYATKLKRDPFNALNEFGVDYDYLTNAAMGDGKPDPTVLMDQLKEEMSSSFKQQLEEVRESLKKEYEERLSKEREEYLKTLEEKEQERGLQEFMTDITDFVNSNSEDYKLIIKKNAVNEVFDYMDGYYAKTGKLIDMKDAADVVEEYYREEAKQLAEALGFQPRQPEPASNKQRPQEQRSTLSNDDATVTSQQVKNVYGEDSEFMQAVQRLKWDQ